MESSASHPKARQYLDNLANASRYTFTTADARAALGLSQAALKVALNRLAHLLDPADDRAFGDRLAHLRHHDIGGHGFPPRVTALNED